MMDKFAVYNEKRIEATDNSQTIKKISFGVGSNAAAYGDYIFKGNTKKIITWKFKINKTDAAHIAFGIADAELVNDYFCNKEGSYGYYLSDGQGYENGKAIKRYGEKIRKNSTTTQITMQFNGINGTIKFAVGDRRRIKRKFDELQIKNVEINYKMACCLRIPGDSISLLSFNVNNRGHDDDDDVKETENKKDQQQQPPPQPQPHQAEIERLKVDKARSYQVTLNLNAQKMDLEQELDSTQNENRALQQHINHLVSSQEHLFKQYNQQNDQIQQLFQQLGNVQDENILSMIDKLKKTMDINTAEFNKEISANSRKIEKLTENQDEMKQDIEETKQSITSLSDRVESIDQAVEQREITMIKIEDKINNMLSMTPKTINFQLDISKLCYHGGRNVELFYRTIAKKVSIMFFDAKVVISDFIEHQIPTKSKAVKGINIASKVVEKLAKDIPFVSTVINLVRSGIKAGYDLLVLKSLATNAIEFECMLGGDGTKFAAEFALKITRKCIPKIKVIKSDYTLNTDADKRRKSINGEIKKMATEYADNLIKIISTGHGDSIYQLYNIKQDAKLSYLDVFVCLAIYHPKQSSASKKSLRQNAMEKEKYLELTKSVVLSDDAKELVSSYFDSFGTSDFIGNVIEIAQEKLISI